MEDTDGKLTEKQKKYELCKAVITEAKKVIVLNGGKDITIVRGEK